MQFTASVRDTKKDTAHALRRKGTIPAILYGHGFENISLSLPQQLFRKVFEKSGESKLVDLFIEGKDGVPMKILIHEVQRHPVTLEFLHADFYRVRMDEKIFSTIPITFVSESPAVATLGGVLVKNKDSVEVECLPGDLPSAFTVDISLLKEINDRIQVKDLEETPNVHVLDDPEDSIAVVIRERVSEERVDSSAEPKSTASVESASATTHGGAGVSAQRAQEDKATKQHREKK